MCDHRGHTLFMRLELERKTLRKNNYQNIGGRGIFSGSVGSSGS
jgi:hypothetical protein